MCVPVCVSLCLFIQSTVDTVLDYLTCVFGCSYTMYCMLCLGGHVRQEKWLWREYLVSGALQEMKNENESGGGARSTCHRRGAAISDRKLIMYSCKFVLLFWLEGLVGGVERNSTECIFPQYELI